MIHQPTRTRSQRHWPSGFCPQDLQRSRLFHAPLQRDLNFGGIGALTFTRATTATYIDQDTGLITAAASGEARFEANGYFAEGARTNLCLQSQELGTTWTITNTGTRTQDTVSPDGTTTAWTLADTDAVSFMVLGQTFTVADDSNPHAVAVFIKKTTSAATFPIVELDYANGTAARATYIVNTDTGALGELNAGDSTKVTSVGNYWLVSVVKSNNGTGNTAFRIFLYPAGSDDGTTADATLQGTSVWWGVNLEQASFSSSYIPTTTVAVPRNADALTFPVAGNINEATGTMYAETDMAATSEGVPVILKIGADSADYHMLRRSTSSPNYVTEDGNVQQAGIIATGDNFDGAVKSVAAAWALNDFELFSSGASRGTDTSGTIGSPATSISVGFDVAITATKAWAHVRNVQIFSERLSSYDISRIR